MPYQNAHVKVTMFGTSCAGAEEWSTGFRMGTETEGGANFGINKPWLDSLLPLWSTFFTSALVKVHSSWKTQGIKAAVILPGGNTDLANVETSYYNTPIAGAGVSSPQAPQVSVVAQLAAANNMGLGSKGRMYLPGIAVALPDSGFIPTADCVNIANGLRTFLDAAESAAGSPGYVINASKGRPGVPFTAPVNRRVAFVRVGNVYDTQRRRRNGLTEQYSTAAMAA